MLIGASVPVCVSRVAGYESSLAQCTIVDMRLSINAIVRKILSSSLFKN